VARVRRIAGQRQVGHGGTLDPMATGVLALGLGQGTRLLEFVSDGRKTYEATVRFGAATDSYDADGSITVEADWRHLTEDGVRKALAGFVGDILQRPPAFSAIKRAGVPLYQLARRGEHVEVEPREVTVFRLEVIRLDLPDLELIVEVQQRDLRAQSSPRPRTDSWFRCLPDLPAPYGSGHARDRRCRDARNSRRRRARTSRTQPPGARSAGVAVTRDHREF